MYNIPDTLSLSYTSVSKPVPGLKAFVISKRGQPVIFHFFFNMLIVISEDKATH